MNDTATALAALNKDICDLLMVEDLTEEQLVEASEGLLPRLHDAILRHLNAAKPTTDDTLAEAPSDLPTWRHTYDPRKQPDPADVAKLAAARERVAAMAPPEEPDRLATLPARSYMDQAPTDEESRAFWLDIIQDEAGIIDLDQVFKELRDYQMILGYYGSVLHHITGGQCSKQNTHPSVVCQLADEHYCEVTGEDEPTIKAALLPLFRDALSWGVVYGQVIPADQWDGEGDKLDLYVTEQSIQHVRLHLASLIKRQDQLDALPGGRAQLTPRQRIEYDLIGAAVSDFKAMLLGR